MGIAVDGGSTARRASNRNSSIWAVAILNSGRDCSTISFAAALSARSSAFPPLGHLGISTFLGIGFFSVWFRLILSLVINNHVDVRIKQSNIGTTCRD